MSNVSFALPVEYAESVRKSLLKNNIPFKEKEESEDVFLKASQEVLAKDWDSEEDQYFDTLYQENN